MRIEMDFLSGALCLFLALISIQYLVSLPRGRKIKKLPPGPVPLPIIGSLHKLGDQPHQSLAELAKVYGPIISLKLGQITTVVISSSTVAKEVLQKQDLTFSTRFVPDAARAHDHYKFSVAWLPVATRWRNLRKFLNSNIFSATRLDADQHLRYKKVEELVTYCRRSSQSGDAVNIGRAAFRTALNLLSNTIFSKDLADPYEDSAKEFKELVSGIMVEIGKPNLVDYFPLLKRIDPQGIRRRMDVHFGKVFELFDGLINERLEVRRLRKRDGINLDVIDVCLSIAEENPEEIDRSHIEHMCLELFTAGTYTTSSTLEWAMAEALHNSKTMENAKTELHKVIGKGKIVEETDISRLPYLQSMVKETLRKHPSAPFLIPRKVEVDVEVCGYTVPKGAQVLVNAWAIGRDPTVWEDPLSFKPERFLDSELDVRDRDFELIPFGAGRRICPGLSLAMRMVTMMLGSLINSFDWKLDSGIDPNELDMKEKFGIALQKAQPLLVVPIPIVV